MKPQENSTRKWWNKLGEIFSVKSESSDQKSKTESGEETVTSFQEYGGISPVSEASTQSKQQGTLHKGLTHYERFKLRMARLDAKSPKKTKSKTIQTKKNKEAAKKAKATKKRVTDAKRLLFKRLLLLKQHKDGLRLKKMQCRNTWGRLESSEWTRILDQFLRTVLRSPSADWPQWRRRVNIIVGPANIKKSKLSTSSVGSTFEFQVAAQLRSLGWSVQLLGKSGDQGGDLLAQRNGKVVVIQCKNYSAKVGNSAVQEVATARQFYHASLAAVVAANGFTRQAQALADKTSVMLLLTDQLSVLG